MKKIFSSRKIYISYFTLALLLSSCSTAGLPVATSTPYIIVITNTATVDLAPYMTQAAETVFVQLTETAFTLPTETPLPPSETPTPENTATITPTFTPSVTNTSIWTATPVNTSTPKTPSATATNSGWSCSITFQLIADNTQFGTNEDFDARWTIKNTGSNTWDKEDVDYRYMSGTEMQKFDKIYDLPQTVASGESVTVIVDMKAPGSTGYYETFWALARHSDSFCSLPTRIKVK